mgnify:CR=1 FL=1
MKLGLVPKIIIGIILGTLIGQYMPTEVCRLVVTLSGIFSNFLKFVIPMMILAYVTMGIADLTQGAGKLLLITALLAYGSTLIGGTFSFFVADNLFPSFISSNVTEQLSKVAGVTLEPFFSISIPPILDTISAVVLAFILGLSLSALKGKTIGDTLYGTVKDFSGIIDAVLTHAIIPFLPLYVCGTFVDMTKSGKTFVILGVLWKVFLVVIAMHFILLFVQFMVAGTIGHKNPFMLMKNQVPGYTTALGTQSSAATIPVNKEACDNIGVPKDVSDLVLPMGCTMHMDGSVLSSIVKIAFLYGVFGKDFVGAETYAMAIVVAILSAFVLSGAPGGGLVGEMLIVSMFNFPAEAFPIIATLGFIFDPAATCLNSSGDTIASMIVTRLVEGKDWLVKAVAAKKETA